MNIIRRISIFYFLLPHEKLIMKKYAATFVLGAFAGGSSIAFVSREDIGKNKLEQKVPEAAEYHYFKKLNKGARSDIGQKDLGNQKLQGIKEYKDGSRFIERSWRTPTWENFDIRPKQKWNFNWDCRHYDEYQGADDNRTNLSSNVSNDADLQQTVSLSRATASRHLILVRHGQYNLDGQTDEERSLTELGCEQAQATGQRLSSLNVPISYMVSSTMTRAKETADLIRPFLPDEIPSLPNDAILCEGAPFPPEPRVSAWKPETHYYVDGSRIEAAFRKYFHRAEPDQKQDSFEVVVCHANVIRYFVCRALQLPPEAWLRISLKHGSITWITIRPDGRTSIRALGETGHMPPNKLTNKFTATPF